MINLTIKETDKSNSTFQKQKFKPWNSVELNNLYEALHRTPYLPEGIVKATYDTSVCNFRNEVASYIIERGFCSEPLPLENLHLKIPIADQICTNNAPNLLTTELKNTHDSLIAAYHQVVKYIACEFLGFDVVFEKNPPLRFHFPVPLPDKFLSRRKNHLTHHTDTLFGDYFEQINCWLPLTTCYGTSGLQMLNWRESISLLDEFAKTLDYDFVAFRDFRHSRRQFFEFFDKDDTRQDRLLQNSVGVNSKFGEVIIFDPRRIHGTGENIEEVTRISIDFRLLPLSSYNTISKLVSSNSSQFSTIDDVIAVRGSYYHEKTAFEL